jgi:hypothetical protein
MLPDVTGLGSDAHRALIERVVAHYRQDGRVRAAAGVERMRRSLLALRGQRDTLRPDPGDPAAALAAVIAEAAACFDLGPRRWALLERIDVPQPS